MRFFSVTRRFASSASRTAARSLSSASFSSVTSVITVTVPPKAARRRPTR